MKSSTSCWKRRLSLCCVIVVTGCAKVSVDNECTMSICNDECVAQGHLSGRCVDEECICSETPQPDGDADSDSDSDSDVAPDGCVPACEGRLCGLDPVCGESCGECVIGQVCDDLRGVCCTPDCTGRVCGPDSCGGTCDPGCEEGQVCIAEVGACCTLECTGRECGPDSCGGTCAPGCGDGECNEELGLCCVPSCEGRSCGDDGCGGTCPPGCPLGEGCNEETGECGTCDLVAGTGCPVGERCGLFSRDEGINWDSGCLPLEDDAPGPGEDCEYTTGDPFFGAYANCQGGSYCVLNAPGRGTCHRLCLSEDASNCADVYPDGSGGRVDGVCNLSIFTTPPVEGLLACLMPSGCDPRCQDCAEDADVCLPASDRDDNFATICIPMSRGEELAGEGVVGDECDFLNSCQAGHICLRTGSDMLCHAFCDSVGGVPAGCEFGTCSADGATCDNLGEASWTSIGLGACVGGTG